MISNLQYSSFYITTLGCSKNTVDSEILKGKLHKAGLQWSKPDNCDILIINTCGFILDAKEESIEAIMDAINLKKAGKIKKLLVIGCLVERYKEELEKEIPEVDNFFGVEPFHQVMEELAEDQLAPRELLTPHHYAYLKIAEGCDNSCSFCSIPEIRGFQHSKKIEDLLEEAHYLSSLGVKELILIAQDTTRYGTDLYGKKMLRELLAQLLDEKLFPRVRLMYTNPDFWDSGINALYNKYTEFCPYVDLPIQHAADSLLDKMNRKKNKEEIRYIISKLRNDVEEIVIRTTVMVGFPGETQKEFYELLDFIEEMKFERLGAFKYSEEEGTEAAAFEDNISEQVKEDRLEMVMQTQYDISNAFARDKVGKELNVIIDKKDGNEAQGRTVWDAPDVDCDVYIQDSEVQVGNIYKVLITEVRDFDLIGKIKGEVKI
ncbi:MAG: 30S ribosomal protein S12 methylthiotransferase RimO [Candidatus Marinimicrobia bacterium]|nr:30S ribosomal protein S12 methylthiotransferase RimO [Candidatus Neomarinimicrobiota bacterium]